MIGGFSHTSAFRSGLTLKKNKICFLLVRPDTHQDNCRSLFHYFQKFDLDGEQFDLQEIGQRKGETYHHAMHWREPLTSVPELHNKVTPVATDMVRQAHHEEWRDAIFFKRLILNLFKDSPPKRITN